MAEENKSHSTNVVELAKRRRQQRTLAGARAERSRFGHGRAKPDNKAKPTPKLIIYIQFIALLAIVAAIMRMCRGG